MKFTFKTEHPTCRYRSFSQDSHHIKLNKIEVGSIEPEAPFKIRLMVIKSDIMEDGNPNCIWKWIRLKKESASLQEAKDFLNGHFSSIISKYQLVNKLIELSNVVVEHFNLSDETCNEVQDIIMKNNKNNKLLLEKESVIKFFTIHVICPQCLSFYGPHCVCSKLELL